MWVYLFRYEIVALFRASPGSFLCIHINNFQIRAESNQSIKFLVTPVDFTSNWTNILAEKVFIEYLLVESIKVEWTLNITSSDFCDLTRQSDNSGGLLTLELNFDCKICSADGADISITQFKLIEKQLGIYKVCCFCHDDVKFIKCCERGKNWQIIQHYDSLLVIQSSILASQELQKRHGWKIEQPFSPKQYIWRLERPQDIVK